jgi:t-SNARE complex subunit (syntaxin)
MSTAMQDEIVIDQRSLREKAVSWRKQATASAQKAYAATTKAVAASARYVRRHFLVALLYCVYAVVICAGIALVVWFYAWLFGVSPVVFWIFMIWNGSALILGMLSMLAG